MTLNLEREAGEKGTWGDSNAGIWWRLAPVCLQIEAAEERSDVLYC